MHTVGGKGGCTFATVECLLLVVIWQFFLCGFNFSCSWRHCIQILQIRVWSARNDATSDNWVLPIIKCTPVCLIDAPWNFMSVVWILSKSGDMHFFVPNLIGAIFSTLSPCHTYTFSHDVRTATSKNYEDVVRTHGTALELFQTCDKRDADAGELTWTPSHGVRYDLFLTKAVRTRSDKGRGKVSIRT